MVNAKRTSAVAMNECNAECMMMEQQHFLTSISMINDKVVVDAPANIRSTFGSERTIVLHSRLSASSSSSNSQSKVQVLFTNN